MLLIMREYKDDVTRFLRKTPGYGKLSWMNEVLGERNYDNAAKILTELATQHETNLWSKRVELALAKLSTLAARETQTGMQVNLSCFEDETELATIQESVYDNLPHLNEAIDESARLQIANDQFANVSVQSKPALRETLQRALAKLVTRCPVQGDELADLLTLMDPIPAAGLPEENEVAGHEFSLALRALNLSGSIKEDGAYRENLEKIVWRRCMIRDDWERISATAGKTDDEVEADIRSTALFKTIVDYTNGECLLIFLQNKCIRQLTYDSSSQGLASTVSRTTFTDPPTFLTEWMFHISWSPGCSPSNAATYRQSLTTRTVC